MAILLTYGIDTSVQAALSKGNFDQMKTEVENLSKLEKVYLVTMDSQNYSHLFNGNVEHLSCRLFSQSDTSLCKFLDSIIFALVGLLLITKRIKKIDVIVAQGTTTVHSALASLLFHVPNILFLHYFAYKEQFLLKRSLLSYVLQRTELFAIRSATTIVALTQSLKLELSEYGVKSVSVVPNFIDLKEIATLNNRDVLRRKLGLDMTTKIVLFVGRLHPVKNIDALLKSFVHINVSNDCILVILGDGPEKQRLIDLAKSLGISNRVFFKGFKEKKIVLEYMKASDVLVLPSFVEGQPRVVLEAWATGLPVVASKRPGLETLIDDGTDGLLFDFGVEEKLAEKVSLAMNNEIASKITANAEKKVIMYDMVRVLSAQAKIVGKFLP